MRSEAPQGQPSCAASSLLTAKLVNHQQHIQSVAETIHYEVVLPQTTADDVSEYHISSRIFIELRLIKLDEQFL
jgi:hypothetical protein